MKLLLTHVPLSRKNYYGARALGRLQELVEVTLHEGDAPLDPQGVIAAARHVDFIIADRSTPVPAEIFTSLPKLRVVMRSAVDIRNIDVAAASAAGVLVTHDLREAVFLADTVYVMSRRPGRIVMARKIDIPRPRTLATTFEPHFVELVHELRDRISQEHA